jgi:hypothetical protein
VLAVSVLGSGIAALDATVVNIALPTIGRDFGTGVAALQWPRCASTDSYRRPDSRYRVARLGPEPRCASGEAPP